MLDAAAGLGLFALIEAFDHTDLDRIHAALAGRPRAGLLVGINCRDLHSLAIDSYRLADLAPRLPVGLPRVAESGMHTAEDVRRAAACGYGLALVGTALMKAADPARLVQQMSAALRPRRSA